MQAIKESLLKKSEQQPKYLKPSPPPPKYFTKLTEKKLHLQCNFCFSRSSLYKNPNSYAFSCQHLVCNECIPKSFSINNQKARCPVCRQMGTVEKVNLQVESKGRTLGLCLAGLTCPDLITSAFKAFSFYDYQMAQIQRSDVRNTAEREMKEQVKQYKDQVKKNYTVYKKAVNQLIQHQKERDSYVKQFKKLEKALDLQSDTEKRLLEEEKKIDEELKELEEMEKKEKEEQKEQKKQKPDASKNTQVVVKEQQKIGAVDNELKTSAVDSGLKTFLITPKNISAFERPSTVKFNSQFKRSPKEFMSCKFEKEDDFFKKPVNTSIRPNSFESKFLLGSNRRIQNPLDINNTSSNFSSPFIDINFLRPANHTKF